MENGGVSRERNAERNGELTATRYVERIFWGVRFLWWLNSDGGDNTDTRDCRGLF